MKLFLRTSFNRRIPIESNSYRC